MSTESNRNQRKELIGMSDPRLVINQLKLFTSINTSPSLQKEIRRKTTVHVHKKNESSVGDKVKILATRPLSKLKRWRMVELIEKAPVA